MDRKVIRRRVLGFIPGVVLVGLTGDVTWATGDDDENDQCRDFGSPCEGNNQCCDGLLCVAGGGQGAAERCVQCATETDCAQDELCVEGKCVPDVPPVECEVDADCDEGEVCIDGVCTHVDPPDHCKVDADCGEGFICLDGECVNVTPPNAQCTADLTNEQCCIKIVRRVCKRKQSSNKAKRNCRRRGVKRCKSTF